MNERDTSQTQTETTNPSQYADVEFKQLNHDGENQSGPTMFHIPGKKNMGFPTETGERVGSDGEKETVLKIIYKDDDGKIRTAVGSEKDVRRYHVAERERRAGEAAQSRTLAGSALRSEIALPPPAEQTLITGIPEHLRSDDYVPPVVASDASVNRFVSVPTPPNPHGALGYPSREDYFKSLGQKPDSQE